MYDNRIWLFAIPSERVRSGNQSISIISLVLISGCLILLTASPKKYTMTKLVDKKPVFFKDLFKNTVRNVFTEVPGLF